MGNKLYKPKKGTRKEKLNKADRLEIAAMLVAAMILLGWAGWKVKDTFWPMASEVEETESETETEPESVASLEEAAQSEVGTLSKANNWEPQETEMATEVMPEETEALTEAVTEVMTEAATEVASETPVETELAAEPETTAGKKNQKPETKDTMEKEKSTETAKTDKPKATPKTSLQVERANKKRRAWLKQQQEERKKQEEQKMKAETETETKTETEAVTETDAETKTEIETKTETNAEIKAEVETDTETETETAPEPYLYRSNGILNIRKEPNKGAKRLGQCPSGIILDVLEYTEENPRWMKIRYQGITGYVTAEFVLKEDNPEYTG